MSIKLLVEPAFKQVYALQVQYMVSYKQVSPEIMGHKKLNTDGLFSGRDCFFGSREALEAYLERVESNE